MPENNTIKGIKACVFDAYGTLFDVHSAVGKHRPRLGDIADQVSNLRNDHLRGLLYEKWRIY